MKKINKASADDIRAQGWAVAIHNDYSLGGIPHTFWLFTRDGISVKGEGLSDVQALDAVRKQITEVQDTRRFFSKKEVREITKRFVAEKNPKKWDREDLIGHVNGALKEQPNGYLIRILLETGYIE
jgi:hypothetical protein